MQRLINKISPFIVRSQTIKEPKAWAYSLHVLLTELFTKHKTLIPPRTATSLLMGW